MRNLLNDPLWREDDLGAPIADCRDAVSVCLPHWKHVIGYEEGEPAVLQAMQGGYPRFMMPPDVRELNENWTRKEGSDNEAAIVFPDVESAERACAYAGGGGRVVTPADEIVLVMVAPDELTKVLEYRRHTGDIVSSRQARAFLQGRPAKRDFSMEKVLQQRIGKWTGQLEENVYLYANGMAAVFYLHRALRRFRQGKETIQFGFPYTDVLKVQQKFPPGVCFIADEGEAGFQQLEERLKGGGILAVFTEFPNNPLLTLPDPERLRDLCSRHRVPLIIDDTVGSFANVDTLAFADASTASLTKFFCGTCDVMGGSVVVRSDSPYAEVLSQSLGEEAGLPLFAEDTAVLEAGSRDYPQRMTRMNQNGSHLAGWLSNHPKVDIIHYPELSCGEAYNACRKPAGGYGALISVVLRGGEEAAAAFYDSLAMNKGPSLGTNFSLACPYTLLAHYHELEWARSCGLPRHLVRLSVGLEDREDLTERLARALEKA